VPSFRQGLFHGGGHGLLLRAGPEPLQSAGDRALRAEAIRGGLHC